MASPGSRLPRGLHQCPSGPSRWRAHNGRRSGFPGPRCGTGAPASSGIHALVEHTSINPNKAAHIGTCATRFWVTRLSACCAPPAKGGCAELHRQYRRSGGRCGGGFLHLEGNRWPTRVCCWMNSSKRISESTTTVGTLCKDLAVVHERTDRKRGAEEIALRHAARDRERRQRDC